MKFAERLSGLMAENKLNKLSLSKKIGISDRVVGAWVSGESGVKLDNAAAVADFFDVSIDYLAGRTDVRETGIKKEPALGLTENGRELLHYFEQLPEREQLLLIGEARGLLLASEDKGGKGKSEREGKAV